MKCTSTTMIMVLAAGALAAEVAAQTPPPAESAPITLPPPSAEAAPTSSLVVLSTPAATKPGEAPAGGMRAMSLFAIAPPQPPQFHVHDLVQIIVRETSTARSSHELETEKSYSLEGEISAWTDVRLDELLRLQLRGARTTDLPAFDVSVSKDFEGEGDYRRKDDLSARLTAEVIEVLPNGNLILEARTFIRNDEEELSIKLTGICRPQDVTLTNTILSNQIHDLHIEKDHRGELKKANQKGIIAKVLDAIFAY